MPSLGGVTVDTSGARLVGKLSVPPTWTAAAQVANHSGVTYAGGGWTNAVGPTGGGAEAVSAGMPGMPGAAGSRVRWIRSRTTLRNALDCHTAPAVRRMTYQAGCSADTTGVGACRVRGGLVSAPFEELQQVAPVAGLEQGAGAPRQLVVINEAHPPRDFFGDADLQALPTFQGADVIAGVRQ